MLVELVVRAPVSPGSFESRLRTLKLLSSLVICLGPEFEGDRRTYSMSAARCCETKADLSAVFIGLMSQKARAAAVAQA